MPPTAQQGRKQSLYGYANRYTPTKPKVKVVKAAKAKAVVNPLDALYRRLQGQVLTNAQIEKKAQELAGTQMSSSLDLVRTESARLRADAERRRGVLTSAMLAAAGENQKMAPEILGGYQQAAQGLGALAGYVTGAVGQAVGQDVAAQSEALARVGQAGPSLDPSQQQGVESYSGGYLPASSLAALGANANTGFLRSVAAQRMQAVEEPWKDYEETIAGLDETELEQLSTLSQKRPELVAKVLESLQSNQQSISKSIIDIEQERRQIRQQVAKIQQAEAELKYKYAKARADATTKAQKAALDQWYKTQQVKLSAARNSISQQNANISAGRLQVSQGNLTVAQQNAETSRLNAIGGGTAPGGGKAMSLAEVMASAGRSRRDVPQGTPKSGQSQALANSLERNKVRDALFEQYKLSVPKRLWPALKKQLTAWAYKLPIRKDSSSSESIWSTG